MCSCNTASIVLKVAMCPGACVSFLGLGEAGHAANPGRVGQTEDSYSMVTMSKSAFLSQELRPGGRVWEHHLLKTGEIGGQKEAETSVISWTHQPSTLNSGDVEANTHTHVSHFLG